MFSSLPLIYFFLQYYILTIMKMNSHQISVDSHSKSVGKKNTFYILPELSTQEQLHGIQNQDKNIELQFHQQNVKDRKRTFLSPPILLKAKQISTQKHESSFHLTKKYPQIVQIPLQNKCEKRELTKHPQDNLKPPPFLQKRNLKQNSKQRLLLSCKSSPMVKSEKGFQPRFSVQMPQFTKIQNSSAFSNEKSCQNFLVKSQGNKKISNSEKNSYAESHKKSQFSHKESGNFLAIPNRLKNRAISMSEQDPNSPKRSKVPKFIKDKQYARSQKQSESKSSTQKSFNLFAMLNSSQIQSSQKLSQNEESSIKINIKPAQKSFSVDDFELIEELGSGSYGKAFLAIEKKLNFMCVLKIIEKKKFTDYDFNNLSRQIKLQSFLNHQRLTSLYGFFADDEKIYLVMELLPSGTINEYKKNRLLPQNDVSEIIHQVCEGINQMHKHHIMHRDIKPQNIFTFGNFIKIGDFGCAVRSENVRTSFVGSPCYLSPQQLRNESYSEKVDIWEIGTLTYELLFNKCPFEKDILEMVNGSRNVETLSDLEFPSRISVSEQAKDFLQRTLSKNPYERMTLSEVLSHRFLMNKGQEPEYFP